MFSSKRRKPYLIPVILACAISTLLITLIQVVFFSDDSNHLIFHQNLHVNYEQSSPSLSPISNSFDHDNEFRSGNESESQSCQKNDFYQVKLQEAESELDNLKKQLQDNNPTGKSNYKIGQFHYNSNDIFNYDIGKGEPSFHRFMSEYIDFYLKHKQTIMHPMREYRDYSIYGRPEKVNIEEYGRSDPEDPLSEETLRGFLKNPKELVEELTRNHKIITDAIPSHAPFPFYKGNGYILAANGLYVWQALLNIEVFRALGSKLPIELLINVESESDDTICNVILPKLNARCIHMPTVFGADVMSKIKFGAFQFKILAMLGSRFQNVFFFDCDAMPVRNPDYLFEWEVYKSHGMVLWPDIIKRTTSPDMFKIQGIQVEKEIVRHVADVFTDPKYYKLDKKDEDINWERDVNFHDRKGALPDWSTGGGAILMNKYTHFDVLLLTLYYNLDGPFGYYPLITQSGPGEGDKDTFAFAAHFYNRPYYQPPRPPHYLGVGIQCFESEPVSDFEKLQEAVNDIKVKMERGEKYDYLKMFHDKIEYPNREFLFYHMHQPKWDPFRFMREKMTLNDKGEDQRLLGWMKDVMDLELVCYANMYHDICEMEYQFTCFEGHSQEEKDAICGFLKHRMEWLDDNTWDKKFKGYSYAKFVKEVES
ncbi:unnamed protein product [Ambrosiozyma monospora]|uniref:Unnamed protein product n=1 Tax=Ambrosiozyma monospora TaxID=43982 RepID=A0A9W6YZ12_AMBMO|nr:unnamed protein product [Ambrosiozyma monospora]